MGPICCAACLSALCLAFLMSLQVLAPMLGMHAALSTCHYTPHPGLLGSVQPHPVAPCADPTMTSELPWGVAQGAVRQDRGQACTHMCQACTAMQSACGSSLGHKTRAPAADTVPTSCVSHGGCMHESSTCHGPAVTSQLEG